MVILFSGAASSKTRVRARERLQMLCRLYQCLLVSSRVFMAFKSIPQTMFILFAGIPTAIAGGVWLQYLLGYNFSVAVWVGFISIFGIVDDNSILITTYINGLFGERKMKSVQDIRNTILMAGTRRIRPCMMTAATTFYRSHAHPYGQQALALRVAKPSGNSLHWRYGNGNGRVFIIPCLNAWHKNTN